MRKIILLSLLIIIPIFASAQYKAGMFGKKSSASKRSSFAGKKSKARREYIVGIGVANFLGELGGANQVGTHFVKDLEFSTTRPSFALGLRYKFVRHFAVKGGFYYQLVSGADKLTKEPVRNNRNLSFRCPIYELSVQAEFYFTKEGQGASVYKIKNAKGSMFSGLSGYLFVGIGGFFYNPEALYNGKWVSLQPLGTEGQGLPGGPKKYSRISACIPYGIGFKYSIKRDWSVGLEVGIRKTFTDYIDDVSTKYYDNAAIKSARGEMAAYLADPSINTMPAEPNGNIPGGWQSAPGEARGDPKQKDAYMFLNITASYKIPSRKRTRSKF